MYLGGEAWTFESWIDFKDSTRETERVFISNFDSHNIINIEQNKKSSKINYNMTSTLKATRPFCINSWTSDNKIKQIAET